MVDAVARLTCVAHEMGVRSIEPWHISEETFRPEMNEIAESLFSLANEYMGTRGNFEEG